MAKVGLCEDDPAIRRVVNDAMRLAGHDVVLAHNGAEALRLFGEDDDLDVIILDIGLPDADGRDVCQALRSAGQPAPVLFLTALGAVHDRLAGFSAGADDYLPKPFDVKELIARVEALAKRGRIVTGQASDRPGPRPRPARAGLRGARGDADADRVPDAGGDHVAPRRGRTPPGGRGRGVAQRRHGQREHRRLLHPADPREAAEVGSPLQLTTVRGVGYTLR